MEDMAKNEVSAVNPSVGSFEANHDSTKSNENSTDINVPNIPAEIVFELKHDLEDTKQNKDAQKFDTDEHIAIGDMAFSYFLNQLKDNLQYQPIVLKDVMNCLALDESEERKVYDVEKNKLVNKKVITLALTDKLFLTPGEVVALAGDFFGQPLKPIKMLTAAPNFSQHQETLYCSSPIHHTSQSDKSIKQQPNIHLIQKAVNIRGAKQITIIQHGGENTNQIVDEIESKTEGVGLEQTQRKLL